jgi:hypothetical protein
VLDEQAKRKPNFSERNSAPVVLADGQSWWVPKPWFEVRPVFQQGRAVNAYPVLTNGPELDELVTAMTDCDDRMSQVTAAASLAAYLLAWHYDLADPELDQLLAFRADNEGSLTWLREVFAIATGQSGPKVSSAGGG